MAQRENNTNKKMYNSAFAQTIHFIVDSTHPSPTGVQIRTMIITNETTGFACTDKRLHEDSADYAAVQLTGMQYNGDYENVSVTGGTVLCIIG